MTKVTFTLDDDTVEAIRAIATRKRRPRSLAGRFGQVCQTALPLGVRR